jgi:predicted transglutaminase-like cysteine proteinase
MVKLSSFPSLQFHALIGAWMVALALVSLPLVGKADSLPMFNTVAMESRDLSAFPKWTRVIYYSQQEMQMLPARADWQHLIHAATGVNLETLRHVNQQVNRYHYIEDNKGWQRQDYWATPSQFFGKGGGDCEDYAIVKYMALRAIGWNPQAMRILVLKDTKINQMHAVLAVNLNGKTYILDNQLKDIAQDRELSHYIPIYSINEYGWWRHMPASA